MKEDAVRSREVQSPSGEYARPFGPEGLAPTTAHQEELAELRNLKGQEFDRQFARDMVKDHQTLIERLTTVRSRINDSELVKLIDKILPTLEKHQKMAEKLESGSRTAG